MHFYRILFSTVLGLATGLVAFGAEGVGDDVSFFEKRIRPVLTRHCYECHSAASTEVKGGLRLDSRDFIRKGGESGPAVVPGNTEKSLLLDAIRHETFEMPPDKKLPANVIADFVKWIEAGAADPRDRPPSAEEASEISWKTILNQRRNWWSLQPVVAFDPPATQTVPGAKYPIDAFISARQKTAGIKLGKAANPRVLARRLSLVLTGLPPAYADVDRFVKDSQRDPDAAYETLVDLLLNSQHFGEHWARHWMDVVRFAETHGYEWNHEIRDAWRYRDYLIRAFNDDVPYDQLVREHIAGDLLETPRLNERLGINESIIGTAFWRFGELGHDDCVEFPEIRFDALDNQIDTFAKAFQGLTISCARCHDHKIDAISTKDYYALVGILENCSQIVHTIDSPQRIAEVVSQTQQIKREIRAELGKKWLAAVDESQQAFRAAIQGNGGTTTLEKHVANEKLDRADPGYILGRLARRDPGADSESLADTSDLRNAHWLWYPEGNAAVDAPIESRYFRRKIVIPEDRRVTEAVCFFAGDDSVMFYVNGDPIGTGNGHPNLVGVDLTEKLKRGTNELAAVITNAKAPVKQNPGGWIGVVRVEFEQGDPLLLYSDSNWKSVRTVTKGWQTSSFADGDWVAAMELGKAGIGPWGFPWQEQSQVRREVSLESLWPILSKEYTAEHNRRTKLNAENFEVWTDFGSSDANDWSASGLGLSNGQSRAGEFTLTHDGDQVFATILPAGLYTNVTSDRLNGSLRSPWMPTEKKYVSLQLVGDGRSMIRPVVDSCGLNEFAGGGLQYLAGGETTWKRLPTSAGGVHRSFVELTTKSDNPRWPDRPGRAGTTDAKELQSPRSSFGVMRAVLHDSPTAPLPQLEPFLALFEKPQPVDEADIVNVFQTVARNAVTAWQNDRATDTDVFWINWLLKVGLLPNSVDNDQHLSDLLQRYRDVAATIPEPRVVAGLADQGSRRGFPVLQGGDPLKPGAVVQPRYIEVIADASEPWGSQRSGLHGSGRRELADLIASSSNPLTARVMVNRVWHHLFGRGIVATPDDFGGMGERPTHPELLDFMATGFAGDDWSIKRLVRRIVLTKAFRQSSLPDSQAVQVDPGNHLLHHYSAHRLSAESVRDTILAMSGRLDTRLFGPSIHPYRKDETDYRKLFIGPLDGDGRRSIYTKVTRMEGPQFLELFDFPNPMATRGRRDRTNVPAQALALLNDPFVVDQAKFWAEQLVAADHESIEERVRSMFHRALGRPPSQTEHGRFVMLVRQLAGEASASDADLLQNTSVWQDAAHAVFNMKEVIYIR
jgi:hypothetical protein